MPQKQAAHTLYAPSGLATPKVLIIYEMVFFILVAPQLYSD